MAQDDVEFGMNMRQALEVSRINHSRGLNVTVELGIPEEVLKKLEVMGHKIRRRTIFGGGGGAQRIIFDRQNGVMMGGSTPHKDSMAVAY